MKKILSYILFSLFALILLPGIAQSQFIKASVRIGTGPNPSLIIVVKPNYNFNAQFGEMGFALQIPRTLISSAAPSTPVAFPTITPLNKFLTPTTFVWSQIYDTENNDPDYYVFEIGAVADPSTAPVINIPAGTELQVVELEISVPAELLPYIRLAHIDHGGPNTQFGFAILEGVTDRTDYTQMFYGRGLTPVIPAATPQAGYDTYQAVLPSAAAGPLPVKFIGFTATKKDNSAILSWQIESETSLTDRYEVERSLNGTDFKKVYTVAPKNNGLSANSYSITDAGLASLSAASIVYYRVKQADKDGKFVYTEIKNIRLTGKGIIAAIYPNPVKSKATLSLDLVENSLVTITINDVNGKKLQNIQLNGFKGLNKKEISMDKFAAGNYNVQIFAGGEMKNLGVIKSN